MLEEAEIVPKSMPIVSGTIMSSVRASSSCTLPGSKGHTYLLTTCERNSILDASSYTSQQIWQF